jgi:nitroimidazol reductase NimA-like FMN-containing flavoprotein (pyridoxamine 5'-phosphate oxidase superfamily)
VEIMTMDRSNGESIPSRWVRAPRVRHLDRRQIEFLLARNHLGRLVYVAQERVEVRPVHYVYAQGSVFGRTSGIERVFTARTPPEVAFEIDEADSLFRWRSVIVRGPFSILHERGSSGDEISYRAALDAIRSLIPGAFTERDPTPERGEIFRIVPREITGREAGSR